MNQRTVTVWGKLIAITGWGQKSDKDRALEAGFDHHFTKPVEPQRVSELLRLSLNHAAK